jgi:hypothetical protein
MPARLLHLLCYSGVHVGIRSQATSGPHPLWGRTQLEGKGRIALPTAIVT